MGFLVAVAKHWVVIMSGAVAEGIVVYLRLSGERDIPNWSFWTIALVFVFVACWLAWNDEHRKRLIAEEDRDGRNPKVVLEYYWRRNGDNGIPDDDNTPIRLSVEGQEAAANVQIQPITRNDIGASFEPVQKLEKRRPINLHANVA